MKVLLVSLVVGVMLGVGGIIGWRVQNYRWTNGAVEREAHIRTLRAAASKDWGVPEEVQGRMSLFILAGQSNMSGRGDLPSSIDPNSHIFVLGNDGRWKIAAEPVDSPIGQIDLVSEDLYAGVGPGMSFASEILNRFPEQYIGLVPVAKGGTSLHEWRRNLSDTALYGSFLKRARAAATMGRIEAFLWFQGEADSRDPVEWSEKRPLGSRWNEGFEELVKNVRADLGIPDLPIIYAQIGTHKDPEFYLYWEEVKSSQPRVRIPRVAMIKSEDLVLKDRVHFTTESYEEIGRRFASAYVVMTNSFD